MWVLARVGPVARPATGSQLRAGSRRRLAWALASIAAAAVLIAPPAAGAPAATSAAGPAAATSAAPAYQAPLPGALRVLAAFDPPATAYSAGHRGVDLAAAPGSSVRAAAAGVVRFAGMVAGRGVVVIEHSDGISTEYEPIAPQVDADEPVLAGQVIGVLSGTHARCQPASCLHWGARRGTDYLDPMSLLAALGPVRLVPWRP